MDQIVILGGGIAANMCAAYLHKKLPDTPVTIIGKDDRKRPIVGESLVEFPTRFFYEVGAGHLLEEKHSPKYGLTYYHKQALEDPSSLRYFVAESQGHPRFPSFNLNRDVFDADFAALNRLRGTKFIDAHVREVELGTMGARHRVTYVEKGGEPKTIEARWVIDTTGRSGLIARKLGLRKKVKHQRSCFWFRLEDFDPNILAKIQSIKPENWTFDSYNVTHHLFGRGNWMWLIPMRSDRPRSRISIGITWRPDVYPHASRITNIDEFLAAVAKEHPIVCDLVRSGRVVDKNLYLNYLYDSERYYDKDGWFLVGDAARCYDPLFSTGMLNNAMQATQVAAMIAKDQKSVLTKEYVDGLNVIFKKLTSYSYNGVSLMYEHMHDPVKTAWFIRHLNNGYFYALLPVLSLGWHTDSRLPRILRGGVEQTPEQINPILDLSEHVSQYAGATREVMDSNVRGFNSMVRGFRALDENRSTPAVLFSRLFKERARLRFELLRHAHPKRAARELVNCAGELAQAAAIRAVGVLVRRGDPETEQKYARPFSFMRRYFDGEEAQPFWPLYQKPEAPTSDALDENAPARDRVSEAMGDDASAASN